MAFSIHEIGQINDRLANISSTYKTRDILFNKEKHSIYVDNLHCAYLELGKTYVLPSCSSMNGPNYISVQEYLDQILPLAPMLFDSMQLLPEPRPKKEIGKIFLTKEIPSVGSQKFILVLSIDFFYLGGAKPSEILQKSTQELTSSVKSSRIYFKISIVPVQEIFYKRGRIVGFDTLEMKELLEFKQSNEAGSSRILPITVMFDDIDFQAQESLLQKALNIQDSNWKLGKIYTLAGMDFLSFSLRFLIPDISFIEKKWSEIGPEIWNRITSLERYIDTNSSDQDLKKFHSFLRQHRAESEMSASGNLCWKIDLDS